MDNQRSNFQASQPQTWRSNPAHAQENMRTIGSFDAPYYHNSGYGIRSPPIEADFEIKPSFIQLVIESKFLGIAMEDPYDHLDYFEKLCRTFRIEGVPDDSIKLILFPLSLGDKARQWSRVIPSRLVNSWDDCKRIFLLEFQSEQTTATITMFDASHYHESRYGIRPPPIEASAYKIKAGRIRIIQGSKFLGLETENPFDHLDFFEDLCSMFRIEGVPDDSIKLILFPLSLGEKASQWEKAMPSHLVNSWNDCTKIFLRQFYPERKTVQVRNSILSFKQGIHERFHEAWDRLNGYTRDCPHLRFSQEAILGIFYRGVEDMRKLTLDAASKGCFEDLTVEQRELLVKNFAQSERNYYERHLYK